MSGIFLLSYRGAQDEYLSQPISGDNPFAHSWYRHSNFSQHQKRLSPNIPVKRSNENKKYRFLVEKNGDMLKEIYLKLKLDYDAARMKYDTTFVGAYPTTTVPSDGLKRLQLYQIMESARLIIGGQVVEEIYPEWIMFYYTQIAVKNLNAIDDGLNPIVTSGGVFHMPLPFWFTRNPGTSIPLIALKNHKVEVEITLRDHETFNKSVWISQPPATKLASPAVNNPYESVVLDLKIGDNTYEVNMYAEYILLDSAERRKFQEQPQEYLITQVQRRITYPKNKEGQQSIARGDTFSTGKINLNHPCKYMMWYYLTNFNQKNANADVSKNQTPWTGMAGQVPDTIKVLINGKDLVPERSAGWWRLYKSWENKQMVHYYPWYFYSWSRDTDKYQPTGHLNMSRVKDLEIITKRIDRFSGSLGCWVPFGPYFIVTYGTLTDLRQVILAENYNILRFDSGQAGLAFIA